MSRHVRDYYTIAVPGDAADTIPELADLAINEARERAKLYCVPCEWSAWAIAGDVGDWEVVFRVRRTRNKAQNHGTP